MNMLKDLNNALDYIESNLTGEIDLAKAAQLARCSEYHFSRMFSFLAGITLSAFELSNSNLKITDLALKYGYRSPDAFTRAFQNMHGVTPSEAKHHGQLLKAFPRMTFQLSIKGGSEMNYRIVEKEGFRIVGIMDRIPIVFRGENPAITALVQRLTPEIISQLKELSDIDQKESSMHLLIFPQAGWKKRVNWIIISV